MRITERLNVEHGVFLRQLEYLQQLVRENAPAPVLQAVARTITDGMRAHRRLEDEHLYPLLDRLLGQGFPLYADVSAEHAKIDEGLKAMEAGVFDRDRLAAFIADLEAHIETEIHVLFPLAESWVPAEKLSSMNNWYVDHIHERNDSGHRPSEHWLG
jgi:hemerythrin-like domain-containing protein